MSLIKPSSFLIGDPFDCGEVPTSLQDLLYNQTVFCCETVRVSVLSVTWDLHLTFIHIEDCISTGTTINNTSAL